MLRCALMVAALVLAACATSSETYTPTGQKGYAIDCSYSGLTWNDCYKKAGELCAVRGYTVLSTSAEQQSTLSGTSYGLYGSTAVTRSMLVQCNS